MLRILGGFCILFYFFFCISISFLLYFFYLYFFSFCILFYFFFCNSLKTADISANSYSTESHQQEQGSDYNDAAMSLRNEDKNNTVTPDLKRRLNSITDNRVFRKQKTESLCGSNTIRSN